MEHVTPTAFWSTVSIIAAAIGSSFWLTVSHADEPLHSEAASESDVSAIEVKLERVATDVEHNSDVLGELKDDLKDLRIEQSTATREILEAIRDN
tara:strand:+ start:127 stop:411 length:285 start_codon:yes stop_codon:yes gene_type:complete